MLQSGPFDEDAFSHNTLRCLECMRRLQKDQCEPGDPRRSAAPERKTTVCIPHKASFIEYIIYIHLTAIIPVLPQ